MLYVATVSVKIEKNKPTNAEAPSRVPTTC